ncbi:peptide chain release factor 1 [Flexilinea flocculi]|jgi:peptide chain release factor 1|uniref:Peptide chain release factor 1 n=1 Tax=Flexilinea flocculi TaxID=1678840 RepID=A0A0S7BVK7_9CHLR|nr:peptide chain release factor 1 [Flexilinea flocculi]NMB94076.1 peptide chain release factor 1 [Flexilinea flocculi]GAP40600.1 bacterial peptide chain release factor 1 [Flexilinea flocculi]
MLEKIDAIESRYEEINHLIEQNTDDFQKTAELMKERAEIEEIVEKGRLYKLTLERIDEARELEKDPEMSELAAAELEELIPRVTELEKEIRNLLIPKDPRDSKNVIIEIRAGTGGDEAAIFASDLFRMYSHYAEARHWHLEILSANEIGVGGYKEITFMVKGKGAYSRLKFESGTHRVQRVPITESQGRIHTSAVTVAVLAEVEDLDIQIPESDIKIEVFKSAGAGGQNVQKNSTAVRLIHNPTGMVITCQDERSQLQNKTRAMSILRARLYDMEQQKRQDELDATRRSMVGTGDRSEKIRTYNYPQSRVTDHRINVSSFNLSGVMNGDLDLFIDELILKDETERLSVSNQE